MDATVIRIQIYLFTYLENSQLMTLYNTMKSIDFAASPGDRITETLCLTKLRAKVHGYFQC